LIIIVFLDSYDEKTACQKILEKKGLKGYQVTFIFYAMARVSRTLFKDAILNKIADFF